MRGGFSTWACAPLFVILPGADVPESNVTRHRRPRQFSCPPQRSRRRTSCGTGARLDEAGATSFTGSHCAGQLFTAAPPALPECIRSRRGFGDVGGTLVGIKKTVRHHERVDDERRFEHRTTRTRTTRTRWPPRAHLPRRRGSPRVGQVRTLVHPATAKRPLPRPQSRPHLVPHRRRYHRRDRSDPPTSHHTNTFGPTTTGRHNPPYPAPTLPTPTHTPAEHQMSNRPQRHRRRPESPQCSHPARGPAWAAGSGRARRRVAVPDRGADLGHSVALLQERLAARAASPRRPRPPRLHPVHEESAVARHAGRGTSRGLRCGDPPDWKAAEPTHPPPHRNLLQAPERRAAVRRPPRRRTRIGHRHRPKLRPHGPSSQQVRSPTHRKPATPGPSRHARPRHTTNTSRSTRCSTFQSNNKLEHNRRKPE